MWQNAESRRRMDEAAEHREFYLTHLLPLLTEAPADPLPLRGIPPTQEFCEQVERDLQESARRRRRRWEEPIT
jgi:hypothetical protein